MNQRNVPGIDAAYLAMDTEEGVEVVWNEVMISERKNFQQLEVRLRVIEYEQKSSRFGDSALIFIQFLEYGLGP